MLSAFAGCGDTKENTSDSSATSSSTTTSSAKATEDTTTDAAAEATTEKKDDKKSGSSAEAADFIGKWQCDEIVIDGKSSDNLYGADAFALYQIELNEDNTGSFFSFLISGFLDSDDPIKLTWDTKGSDSVELTVKASDIEGFTSEEDEEDEADTMTLTKEGNRLVLDDGEDSENFKIYLSKVDKFTPIPEDMEMSFGFDGEFSTDFELTEDDLNPASSG